MYGVIRTTESDITTTPEKFAGGLYWMDFTDASTITTTTSGLISNVRDKFTSNDWEQTDVREQPNYNTSTDLGPIEKLAIISLQQS